MDTKSIDANIFEVVRIGGLPTALLLLVGTYAVVRFVTTALKGLGTRWADKRLLINQVATLVRFALWLVGLGLALASAVNLTREVLLAIGGTAAVTLGFALKDVAAAVMAGIVIIIDRPFQTGDRVKFNGVYGEIASIGLRSVRLVTLDEAVVTIPNNKFLTDVVASGNWGALDMIVELDFFVGADQDIAKAERLVEGAITGCRYSFTKKPWFVMVNQVFQGHVVAVRLRAQAHVLDVRYEKEFQSDVTKRVMGAFRKHGILPPAILHRAEGGTAGGPVAAEGLGVSESAVVAEGGVDS